MYNNLYGNFRNRKFTDIWDEDEKFLSDYKESGLYRDNSKISDDAAKTLFWLLYAEYGNSVISSDDEYQFQSKVFSLIYRYGPTWEKNVEIQNRLRSLTDDEISTGSRQIFNKAQNPGTEPTTEELDYISDQTVNKVKRGKLEGYSILADLLRTDVTTEFIKRFSVCFLQIVIPERPLWIVKDDNESEEN